MEAVEAMFLEAEEGGKLFRSLRKGYCYRHGRHCPMLENHNGEADAGVSVMIAGDSLSLCFAAVSTETLRALAAADSVQR